MLTQERLKELMDYNPDTGMFTRKTALPGHLDGGAVGSPTKKGYISVGIDYKTYMCHRLVWLWSYGYFPEYGIDHINRVKDDNRLCNLREISHQCNLRNANKQKNNKSGITGVCWRKRYNVWVAKITVNYKDVWIGTYKNKKDAVKARWKAEVRYGFTNCNTTSSAYQYLKGKGLL